MRLSFVFWLFTGYKVKEGEHIHDWLFYQQYHFANAYSQGRNKFVIYDGDGISEWYEIIILSGKVVSVYLITDRNCVSKPAVILEFLILLLTAWVEFSSEWYRSFQESRE